MWTDLENNPMRGFMTTCLYSQFRKDPMKGCEVIVKKPSTTLNQVAVALLDIDRLTKETIPGEIS